jgi:hypothetical protein
VRKTQLAMTLFRRVHRQRQPHHPGSKCNHDFIHFDIIVHRISNKFSRPIQYGSRWLINRFENRHWAGISVGAVALLAIGICCLVRRRRSRNNSSKSLLHERFQLEEMPSSEIPQQRPRSVEMEQPDRNPQTQTSWKPGTSNSVTELPTKEM